MSRETLSGNYATRRLIAKDVPISKIPQYEKLAKKKGHKAYWFRGRGSRIDAAIAALQDGTWKKALGKDHPWVIEHKTNGKLTNRRYERIYNFLYSKYSQDLPIKYSDRVSVYHRS